MSQTLAEQLLELITQQPQVDITDQSSNQSNSQPNSQQNSEQTVTLAQLESQLLVIEASHVSLNLSDFDKVLSYLVGQLNQQQGQNEHFQLGMREFFAFTLLIKIGVLSDNLHQTFAGEQIKAPLDMLNNTLQFQPAKPIKTVTRRRVSQHRGTVQSNKKSETENKQPINCLTEFNQDIQHWEEDLLAHFMQSATELLNFTPIDFNRAVERLVTIHHHWQLLLQNHLKRLQVWLFNQLQQKNFVLNDQNIDNQQATDCFEQLNHCAHTFSAELQQSNDQQQDNIHQQNYAISRCHIQLLLAQPKLINTASPLLTDRVFKLYESQSNLTENLCHILQLHQPLIDLFWYDVCHFSESMCQLADQAFNRQTLQCFYQAQNFKNLLVNISVSIETLANQLYLSDQHILSTLSRTQHHLLDLVHYQAQIYTEQTDTIGKITIHHSQQDKQHSQFAQLTQVEYANPLIELLQCFDRLVAAVTYRQHQPLSEPQITQIQRLATLNLDTLNQSMDSAYGNWLQLINLLRDNGKTHVSCHNQPIQQSVQEQLRTLSQEALSELVEFGPLPQYQIDESQSSQDHNLHLVPALQLLACLDLNWSAPSDKPKPAKLDKQKFDNLHTAVKQHQISPPENPKQWLQLLLPLLDYQTSLVTLAEQYDTHTQCKQDIVGTKELITLKPTKQQPQIDQLICGAVKDESQQTSEKLILHAPAHLVIAVDQGQEHLVLHNKLALEQNNYTLSAILCQTATGFETWVRYQNAWFHCQKDGIISVTITDKLPQLALQTEFLVYSQSNK